MNPIQYFCTEHLDADNEQIACPGHWFTLGGSFIAQEAPR